MGAPKISTVITEKDYDRLCRILYSTTGIRLGDKKHGLVESRLAKRLQNLGFENFSEYIDHLEKNHAKEFQYLVEAMTTHKTEWFRENIHFDFLKAKLSEVSSRPTHIWSAACSTGEELWTIAIILNSLGCTPSDYRLLGTDISKDVVEKAKEGLYLTKGFQAPPLNPVTRDFFKVRKDLSPVKVEVKEQFRTSVKFKQMNLMQIDLPATLKFDFIFLRNVLIYFDPESSKKVINSLVNHLKPGGYLILGLSESVRDLPPQLENLGRSIYQLGKV